MCAATVLRGPSDVLAAAPQVLGFHPQSSILVLGLGPGVPSARLDHPRDREEAEAAAAQLAEVFGHHKVETTFVVSYCDDREVVSMAARLMREALAEVGVHVVESLMASGGRWWAIDTSSGEFLPPEGEPYDVGSHRVTAEAVFHGRRAPEASRSDLAASLMGSSDPAEGMMVALERLESITDAAGMRAEALWIRARTRQAITEGLPVSAEDAARLLVAWVRSEYRDVAWAEITRETAAACVVLFRDLTRRAPTPVKAQVAGLLAFAAWQQGHGALSWCAVDVALEASPGNTMAQLVTVVLEQAIAPTSWVPLCEEDVTVLAG